MSTIIIIIIIIIARRSSGDGTRLLAIVDRYPLPLIIGIITGMDASQFISDGGDGVPSWIVKSVEGEGDKVVES